MAVSIFVVVALYVTVAASMVEPAESSVFLQAGEKAMEQVRTADVENALSMELSAALVGGYAEAKLSDVELALRPLFATLPKNEHGNLGPATLRYALNRFFLKKHGWSVKGLESGVSAQNVSSPIKILKDRIPSYIEGKFEQQLGGRGFDLRLAAVFASTIEHLVHDEAMGKLQASYFFRQLPSTDLLTKQETEAILDEYMLSKGVQINFSTLGLGKIPMLTYKYQGWDNTQEWTRDMQRSTVYTDRGVSNPFVEGELSFARVAHVVEEIGDRFGKFQDLKCHSLKEALMERENGLPGRVQLSEFDKVNPHFLVETVDYLRQSGALDESDPERPSVVIPNYLSIPSNCLGEGSAFYSLCCIDHCERLMSHLESSISMPTSEPHRIAAIVAAMPSDTIDAPRNLSTALLFRLDSIAQRHSGRVPLHGRLFAQWMHHAYPYECPYPLRNAESAPQAVVARDLSLPSVYHAMPRSVNNSTSDVEASPVANMILPWVDVEDLLVELDAWPVESVRRGSSTMLRNLGFMGALLSFTVSMAHTYKSALSSCDGRTLEKYSV